MAALVCLGCAAVYSVGAPACPQCGATESRGDWEEPAPAPAEPVPAAVSKKNAPAPEGGD